MFGKERSMEEWNWKFHQYLVEKQNILLFEEDNEILGHLASLPLITKYFEEELLVGERVDAMVSPKARGKNIYKKLVTSMVDACAEKDIKLLYGYPAPQAKEIFIRHTGAQEIAKVPELVYINNLPKVMDSVKTNNAKPIEVIVNS